MSRNILVRRTLAVSAGVLCMALAGAARAHISVASGPAFSNTTQEVVFGVGHGCAGNDTWKVTIDMPAGVSSVRPLAGDFGKATVQTNMAGDIVSVTWQKALADALDSDTNYYKLVIRLKTPDKPFTTLYFAAHQTCRAANGDLSTTEWVGLPSDVVPDGGVKPEPAAALLLVPPRQSGWNRYTTPAAIPDPAAFFKDAQIVWKGTAAWSANPNTAALIKSTAGVTALSGLLANDEFWVKY